MRMGDSVGFADDEMKIRQYGWMDGSIASLPVVAQWTHTYLDSYLGRYC